MLDDALSAGGATVRTAVTTADDVVGGGSRIELKVVNAVGSCHKIACITIYAIGIVFDAATIAFTAKDLNAGSKSKLAKTFRITATTLEESLKALGYAIDEDSSKNNYWLFLFTK